jgi:hypothetical protein
MSRCSLATLTADGFDTTACEPLRLGIEGKSVDLSQLVADLAAIDDVPAPDKPSTMPNIRTALLMLARAIVNKFKR